MVKLPHQKHSRNISTVSDISMGERNEPLRRDQKADIKCILLCDSTTEQQEFKKAFEKAIFQLANSANSGISNPKVPLIIFVLHLVIYPCSMETTGWFDLISNGGSKCVLFRL